MRLDETNRFKQKLITMTDNNALLSSMEVTPWIVLVLIIVGIYFITKDNGSNNSKENC